MSAGTSVTTVDLGVSTAYAVTGPDGLTLVDTGPRGREAALLHRLERAGHDPRDIRLIALTHCHPDHAGGAAELQQRLGVPVAVPRPEAEWARRGTSAPYRPVRPFGHLLARVLPRTFPAFEPDHLLDHGDHLDAVVAGSSTPLTALHTPGHTPGSTTYLHRSSRHAFVGDLLAGSVLRADSPQLPFLADDLAQVRDGVATLLEHEPFHLLFGHGKPADGLSLLRAFGHLTGTTQSEETT